MSRECRCCGGAGFVANPDARYYETPGAPGYHTGLYETQDPEEIDCPECGGTGWEPPQKPTPEPRFEEEEIVF